MAARKKKKDITLIEFRAWLEGVEELQPASWHPDATQWKLIRSKIDSIIIEKEVKEVHVPAAAPVQPRPVAMQPPHQAPMPAPSAFDEFAGAQPGPSGLNAPTEVAPEMTPAARAALAGKPIPATGVQPAALTPGADGKIHTPNIDTSQQDYKTGFE